MARGVGRSGGITRAAARIEWDALGDQKPDSESRHPTADSREPTADQKPAPLWQSKRQEKKSGMTKPIIGIGADVSVTPGKRDRAFAYTTYIDALRRAGAVPVLVPPQPENAAEGLEGLDGLVLAGGVDCDPALYGEDRHSTVEPMDIRRQENDLALAQAARELGIPTLRICLGRPMTNVAAGGSLVKDIDSQMETEIRHASQPENRHRHDAAIQPVTQLSSILRESEMN